MSASIRPYALARLLLLCAVLALSGGRGQAQGLNGGQGIPLPTTDNQTESAARQAQTPLPNAPVQLRQALPPAAPAPSSGARARDAAPATPPVPGEFEAFVQRLAGGQPVRRFGAELMTPREQDPAAETSPLIPADYQIKPGDELIVSIWGSAEGDLRLIVDRSGRITLPRIGPVLVAGVRYAELPALLSQRVSQVFRNTQVSATLGQLRGLRVFITGFVARPGAYSVGSLSTVTQALLAAGGPSAAGSLRAIDLRRGAERTAQLDLYELLLKGDRSNDRLLQADDVIHVGPVGTQVALIGSVNRPAVFELKPGETVDDVLRMAGGFTAVADRSRLSVERLDDRATVRISQLSLPASLSAPLVSGDVLRAFSAVDVALPVQRQNKRVRVEGEVLRPGEYVLPPESTINDALAAAGGMTAAAYVYGTEFTRESVRATQEQNYDRALRQLETDLARNSATQRASNAEEAAAQQARESANARLIASLRAVKPTGRVVLQVPTTGRELPPLALEDGDRLSIPSRPTSVGVFGSVFNAGNYLYGEGRKLDDYLGLAGGPTRGADPASAFVIRANGSVISGLQRGGGGWFSDGSGLAGVHAEPGDTVFVPEEPNKTTWVQNAKDWTQILYQFGLGVAALQVLRN